MKVIINHPDFDKDPIPKALLYETSSEEVLTYLLGLKRWKHPSHYLRVAFIATIEMKRCLLEHGANPNKGNYDNSPLSLAVVKDDVEFIKLLLEFGADAYECQWCGTGTKPPLCLAVRNSNVAVTKLLLQHYDGKKVQRGVAQMAFLALHSATAEFNPAHRVVLQYMESIKQTQ